MDERPDVIEQQIERTRDRLDEHLDRLDSKVAVTKEWMKAQAQWWAGVSAVAAGTVGAVAFWPRRHHPRDRRGDCEL
jgi:hypothetical protein